MIVAILAIVITLSTLGYFIYREYKLFKPKFNKGDLLALQNGETWEDTIRILITEVGNKNYRYVYYPTHKSSNQYSSSIYTTNVLYKKIGEDLNEPILNVYKKNLS